jgi:hypothetical protein
VQLPKLEEFLECKLGLAAGGASPRRGSEHNYCFGSEQQKEEEE